MPGKGADVTDPIVETTHLTKTFSRRDTGSRLGVRRTTLTAVDDLTITLHPGEAVGYNGANGAGKSTTIKMLVGILVPSSGHVRTCGLAPLKERRRLAHQIGVVFGQRSQLWWDLPVAESFSILAAIHDLDRDQERRRDRDSAERASLIVENSLGAEGGRTEGTGLGSQLIEAFALQLDGEAEVSASGGVFRLALNFRLATQGALPHPDDHRPVVLTSAARRGARH